MNISLQMVLTVNVKTVYFFLLIFSLYQCISGQPQQHGFLQVKDAVDQQRKYLDQWNRLCSMPEEIEETRHPDYGSPLYRLTGPNVQQMTVKQVFIMLQNWLRVIPEVRDKNNIIPDRRHRFIEMNIGGNDFRFRLYPDKNQQILFATEDSRMIKYADIAEILDSNEGEVQKIAERMLESSKQPLKDQHHWPHSGQNRPTPEIENLYKIKNREEREQNINEIEDGDEREQVWKVLKELEVEDKMRELMVIGQVAEAARPTDVGYTALKNVMIEIWSSEIFEEREIWQEEIEKIFKESEYTGEFDATPVLDDPKFRELVRDIANRDQETKLAFNYIVEFMQELPYEYPPKLREELVNTAISVVNKAKNEGANEGEIWQKEIEEVFSKREYMALDAKPVLENTKL